MGTIRTSIQMFNGMTPGLRSMTNALNIAISSFEAMDRASSHCIDTSSLQTARAELNRAEVAFNQVEASIREAGEQQQVFNNNINHGTRLASGLRGMLAGIGGIMGVQKVVGISDEFSRSTARLGLMAGGMENVNGLQDQIYQSARRTRTSYLGTMDAVAKLGLRAGAVFENSNETIAFVEQLNKQFKIAGASQQEIASATLQLTQALGSGVLRGEEFNSVFEAAPNVMQSVADYMDLPIGKLRDMAADGMITADIVKNAMFAAADETNERFKQIPNTWADVWVMSVNKVIMVSQPLLELIGFLANNWSIIEPIVLGVAFAIGIYATALGITTTAQIAHGAATAISTALNGAWTVSVFAQTVAQQGLNAALLACPITWIILAIIALIAIFYVVIAVINRMKGTTYSATSFIVGAFYVAGAIIGNIFIGFMNLVVSIINTIWNVIATFVEFFANVFDDPVASIARLFMGLFDAILSAVEGVAGALDTLFGSNMAGAVSGFRGRLQGWVDGKFGTGKVTVEKDVLTKVERLNYGDAWTKGKSVGSGISEKMSGLFNGNTTSLPYDNVDQLLQNAGDTAGNTGRMADNMEITEEDLKYLRDVAERETVNRFTTAEIKVDFKNEATINSDLDIDGVMNKFTDVLREAIYTEAEEVHVLV